MIIKREIGEKGQVVIPKDLRNLLGLKKGGKIIFEIKDKEIRIKSEQNPVEFVNDFLNVPKLKKRLNQKEIKNIMLEQYGN